MSMRGHRHLAGYVSTPPIRVAVLEDDEALREEILLPALSDYGFSTQGAASAAELYRHMLSQHFDMVVLDIGLPDEDGLTVARHLRTMSDIGIVMLTGSTDRQHQIQALHSGADGYLIKPIDLDVLAAALHSLARRMTPFPQGIVADQAPAPRWRLEADGWRLVSPRGKIVALTAIEQCVLTTLTNASDEPVSRDSLIRALNQSRYDCDPHSLEMIIHRLRRKVHTQTKEMLALLTVRNKGYMLPGDAWHKPTIAVGYDFITDSFVSGRATDDRVPGGWDLGDWDNTQPYLQECYGSNNPNDGEPSSWHGTVVSGEVAELTNNGLGMAGVAYNAKVLPVRVLGHCGGYDSDISDAIEWASGGHIDGVPDLAQPVQVINMSLGGQGTCDATVPEYTAIKDAISRGTTVVVAAGNSTADVSNFTPASCPGVVAVASNGITGKRAFYSNYGKGVTISAPGGGIYANDASSGTEVDNGFVWQAINEGTTTPTYPADPTEAYGGMAGTSQASPHVAGTVALVVGALKAAGLPALSPADMTNVLVKSARAFPVTEDHPIGAGIVDANAAVNLALNNDTPPPNPGNDGTLLTKGVLLSGQNSTSTGNLYSIVVPAGATTLNIRTLGGSGNVGLYVKAGSAPSANGSDADFSSIKPGTSEAVVIPQPQATTYYILVTAPQGSFNNISVLADYNQ